MSNDLVIWVIQLTLVSVETSKMKVFKIKFDYGEEMEIKRIPFENVIMAMEYCQRNSSPSARLSVLS